MIGEALYSYITPTKNKEPLMSPVASPATLDVPLVAPIASAPLVVHAPLVVPVPPVAAAPVPVFYPSMLDRWEIPF